ncbi:YihY/virulence factor BrkB family protein, partial [Streptomyces montanus]
PAAATAAARAVNERLREEQAADLVARAAAARAIDPDDPDMPSEFPERWSRFLPPEDVTSRLRTHVKSSPKNGDVSPPPE